MAGEPLHDDQPEGAQSPVPSPAEMRRRAEARLQERLVGNVDPADRAQVERLVHELGVHQIELEMQNEQLLQTQGELEAARDRYVDLFEQAPAAYLALDGSGLVLQANQRAAVLLGQPVTRLLRRPLTEHMPPDARPRLQLVLRQVLRLGGLRSIELPLQRPDGSTRWAAAELLRVPLQGGAAPQCRMALVDITEQVAQRLGMAQLAAIVGASEDAIVGRDRAGLVTAWNDAAQRLFGIDAAAMLGRTMDALVPPERRDEEAELLRRLRGGEKLAHVETERLHRDGSRLPVAMSLAPLCDDEGRVIGSAMIARDIGARLRAEQVLHRRLRQLDLLAHAGRALIMGEGGPVQVQRELFDRVRLAAGCEIWLRHEVGADGSLRLVDTIGLAESQLAPFATPAADATLFGLVRRHGTPLIVEDLQASERLQAAPLRHAGLCCYAGFALQLRGEVSAVVSFASTTRRRFREGDLQVIQSVCDQVSAMLERQALLDELGRRGQELQRADRAKDDFIATLAHELRNPLAPIANAASALRRADGDPARLAWCREVIGRQVQQMTHLLEDLLDVSRVTRNKIELRRERIDLIRAVELALEATRPLLEAQAHELRVQAPERPAIVFADLTRLTQVLANLLNNAAKYTDAGGHLEVSVRCEDDWGVVAVRDDGIGIDAAQLARVFDMFAQLTPALERSRGGLGIGLSLARGLVELHGGRMEARSDGPGRGSEFVVRLPLVHAAADSEAPAAVEPPPLPRHRLLIVDDNDDAAQSLALLLGLHGQEVRTVNDGAAALVLAEAWRPDTAVIDIGMPGMNGYELCRRLRDQPWGERLLLIACTGWGQAEDRQRARAAGFDHHVVKPVDADALLCLLARRLDPP